LSGFAAGVVARFALQLILAQGVLAVFGSKHGEAGGFVLVAGAVAVRIVPALRRTGAGFLLGVVLGGIAQFALVTYWLSMFS